MRKLFTKVVAIAAAAVMTLGVVTAEKYTIDGDNKDTIEVDVTDAEKVTFTFTFEDDDDGSNGGIGWNDVATGEEKGADKAWKQIQWGAAYEDEVEVLSADVIANESGKKIIQLQTWWVNEGKTIEANVEITGSAAPAESSSSAESSAAAESSSAADDSASKTGDATSVAVLAALALIALGGVVVTSKKRA
ncbi:MAG: LPXTG cell wall anchor domain-containing protein [Lachnospiraceae bacterium]|nr:LPXTG cell wall anchor domain-containing protein [Lachnospiraceae bacterium]